MKQILQNLRTGATEVADVPCPAVKRGHLLIRTTTSLLSVGTERMLVGFGQASLIGKARARPGDVRKVLDKMRTDGLIPTLETVFNRLDQPLPLGYCNVGVVMKVGSGVSGFAVGDRVVSNGRHAEAVLVPKNLCARIPDAVSDEEAAFTVVGAIGLQGMRLAAPSLGEVVVVTGLGLIGLITVQLLRAQGCRVLGIDLDATRVALARRLGADVVNLAAGEDPLAAAREFSRGRGVDSVLITASTDSSAPVHQAATMCRKRGRIVLVGVAGLELSRADFYEKELTFQVSCSYGPGRYDPIYEGKGIDYPVGFVRWTEQRNFEAVLDMLEDRRIETTPLISHRFPISQAESAYELVARDEPSLGILLTYPGGAELPDSEVRRHTIGMHPPADANSGRQRGQHASLGFIGSGSYAAAMLIPAFKATGARLLAVASAGGVSGVYVARKFGFEVTTTDTEVLLRDPTINAVVVATRHASHGGLVLAALEAGKHVFVEKPLCLSLQEADRIEDMHSRLAQAGEAPLVMIGFNRRFAPHVRRVKTFVDGLPGPKAFVMTVNAGAIPADHWTQDITEGGGRVIGEACHFIDLLRFLAGAPIKRSSLARMDAPTGDTVTIQLSFSDGSIGTVHYFANGSRSFPKERLDVFAAGRVLQLDNFRTLTGFGFPGFRSMRLWRQDKGQAACVAAFVNAVKDRGPAPIPFAEILEVARVTIRLANVEGSPG